ncbi:MAG: dihydroneopterin aldolase [Burkholderiaceae bacterium]
MHLEPDPRLAALTKSMRIGLRRLRVHASVGILPHETRLRQPLLCDADVWVEQDAPSQDRIAEVLDYRVVRESLVHSLTEGHTNLLETLADCAARELCRLPRVVAVRLLIEKPNAFDDAEAVGVELFRFRE